MPCFYGIVTYILLFARNVKWFVMKSSMAINRTRKKFHILRISFFFFFYAYVNLTSKRRRWNWNLERIQNRETDTDIIITRRKGKSDEIEIEIEIEMLVLIQIRHGRSGCDDWNFCFHGWMHLLFFDIIYAKADSIGRNASL